MQRWVRVAWCTAAASSSLGCWCRWQVQVVRAQAGRQLVGASCLSSWHRKGSVAAAGASCCVARWLGWVAGRRRGRSALPAGRARRENAGAHGGSSVTATCLVSGWLELGSGSGGVPFGPRGTFSPGVAPVLAGGGLWAAVRYWCALACQRRDSAQASCSITRLSLPSPLPVATPRHLHLLARVALALSSRCMCKQGSGIIATTAWAWRRRPGGERAS